MRQTIDIRLKKYATFSNQAIFETLIDLKVGDLVIEKGFETDGASLPRWVVFTALALVLVGGLSSGFIAKIGLIFGFIAILFAYLFPAFGAYTLAAVAHDKLLTLHDRKTADRKMKKLLDKLEITKFWQLAMYRLVRINSQIKNWVVG